MTLEAHGGANLMVITVRDDGRGLDYDALRRRGVEMGLIAADRHASRAESGEVDLSSRLFDTQCDQRDLRAWCRHGRRRHRLGTNAQLDRSGFDAGTRNERPAADPVAIGHRARDGVSCGRTGIWHSDAVCSVRRFARRRSTRPTFPWHTSLTFSNNSMPHLHLNRRCSCWRGAGRVTRRVRRGADGSSDVSPRREQRLGILVDEIVGPEEVVVRPMPNLLGRQPLFTGVTSVRDR